MGMEIVPDKIAEEEKEKDIENNKKSKNIEKRKKETSAQKSVPKSTKTNYTKNLGIRKKRSQS